jgi:LPS-assembly lipoprotein
MRGRRGLLLGAAGVMALGAGGCGFRPLYGSNGSLAAASEPAVAGELAAVQVPVIPERFGQLLRRALQQRLGTGVAGAQAARWELRVGPSVQSEGIGVLRDGSVTRVRYLATANWQLLRLGPTPEVVANGFERAQDAYNVPPNQFFAADVSRDAAERRIAETLAEEVVTRVAIRFRTGTAGPLIAPVETPAPLPDTISRGVSPGVVEPGVGGGLGGGLGPTGGFR